MKPIIIFAAFGLICYACGCSSSKKAARQGKMNVEKATYHSWSYPPERGDVPEKGTDLSVTVRNWPEGYQPLYIVFRKHESFIASVADLSISKNEMVIHARVVKMSSMLRDKSDSTDKSDRLVFTNRKGKRGYVEITNWKRK